MDALAARPSQATVVLTWLGMETPLASSLEASHQLFARAELQRRAAARPLLPHSPVQGHIETYSSPAEAQYDCGHSILRECAAIKT